MNLSEVFYEAACQISRDRLNDYSCCAVDYVVVGYFTSWQTDISKEYARLVCPRTTGLVRIEDMEEASGEINWPVRHFRTFMLLMASEAVK